MMEEIRKILEAVAKGEITPEEGEKLINALKERGERRKKEDEKEKKAFRVEKGDILKEDIVLSKQDVVIEGKMIGDIVLLNCNTEFSGEVEGDLVIVGGKVRFDGGRVDGDLVLIGARHTGKEPEVSGEYVKLSNFFINGIMTALSPLIGGLRIRGKPFGKGKIHVSSGMKNVVVPKGSNVSMSVVDCEKLIVNGNFEGGNVRAESSIVSGIAEIQELKSEKVIVKSEGLLKVRNLKSEKVVCEGKIESETVEAEVITVGKGGILKARDIKCERMTGDGKVEAEIVEADSIDEKLDLSLKG